MRGITRSVITIAGRKLVTFSSASSPSLADSAMKPQLLTSCSSPLRADGSSSTINTRSAVTFASTCSMTSDPAVVVTRHLSTMSFLHSQLRLAWMQAEPWLISGHLIRWLKICTVRIGREDGMRLVNAGVVSLTIVAGACSGASAGGAVQNSLVTPAQAAARDAHGNPVATNGADRAADTAGASV